MDETLIDRSLAHHAQGAHTVPVQGVIPVLQPYTPVSAPVMAQPQAANSGMTVVTPASSNVTVISPQMQPAMMPAPAPMPTSLPTMQTVSQGSYMQVQDLTVGALFVIGNEVYKVEQVVQPKQPPKEPPKPEPPRPRLSPVFSGKTPKEAANLYKDVWDGRQSGRQARGLLAGCHEVLLVALTHLETRLADLERRGKLGAPKKGRESFFKTSNSDKKSLKDRIDRLVDRGLLLQVVRVAADNVILEPPSEPEARSQVTDADVDAYLSLLWQVLEQGFDHAQWSEDGKAPEHRMPPLAPSTTPPPPPKPELPVGAAVLIPVSRNGPKSA